MKSVLSMFTGDYTLLSGDLAKGEGRLTTSWTQGTGGHDTTRGDGAMRDGGANRWEVAVQGEVTQQPAGLVDTQEGTRPTRAAALVTRVACNKD